jgi:hypothetical protein
MESSISLCVSLGHAGRLEKGGLEGGWEPGGLIRASVSFAWRRGGRKAKPRGGGEKVRALAPGPRVACVRGETGGDAHRAVTGSTGGRRGHVCRTRAPSVGQVHGNKGRKGAGL